MAITTVTTENLAEFAANRKAGNASSQAPVPAGDGPTPGNPVIKAGEAETTGAPPDPGAQPPKDAKAPKPVQPRIDELVRQRNELDEAFQAEYEHRLRLEGELNAVRTQQQPKVEEKPKEDPKPDPEKYTDQKLFLDDRDAWNRREARREFAAEQEQNRQQERLKALNDGMAKKVAAAKADFPDFDEKVEAADRSGRKVPPHVEAAMYESDVGAHIAYYLLNDPAEEKRIFGLPVAKALLELGKIENKFVKAPKASEPAPVTPQPPETTTPAPITRLREGPGITTTDLSQPMDFKSYRQQRLTQIRESGRRRH